MAVNVCAGNNGITLRMAALEAQTLATESEAIEIFYCCTNIYKIQTSRRYWCNGVMFPIHFNLKTSLKSLRLRDLLTFAYLRLPFLTFPYLS